MEFKNIECIFWDASQIDSESDRSAYLGRACAGDVRLRERVDHLLKVRLKADDLLEVPASVAIDDPQLERLGTYVGSYKLLEQIGEGGMGLVFLAEQSQPVRRKVALKVLKPGMDTRQVVAHFEAERQALALMDHPNIAQVFDAGVTPAGRPYFVMELVRGVPITEFCDQRRLTTRQRLDLFVNVCQAVQHAHQKGIIHRDLKPSNILVTLHDTLAVPKVIDFGIAKAMHQPLTERTLFTHFSQMIGTPLYMSPEQAEMNGLDVDTRSDVYALGVLLYELLTGTTPFEADRLKRVGLDEMRRLIREEEPPRPSQRVSTLQADARSTLSERRGTDARTFDSTLRGELDWIVIKALDKDRNRRYESASAFAADVQRYLTNEAVEACPPSSAYRLQKFARRNGRFLATMGIVVVALVTATAVSAWQASVARDALHKAEGDRDRAEQAKKEAAAISEFLQRDLLLQVSRDHMSRDGFPAEPDLTVKDALHRAAARVGKSFQDQPLVEAALRFSIGRAYRSLGDESRAADHLKRSADLRAAHLGADHPDTLKSQVHLAFAFNGSGRRHDTIPMLEHVAERQAATLGPDHEATLFTLNSLGSAYGSNGQLEKAAGLIEQVLEKRKATIGLDHARTANSMHDLGLVYRDQGRYPEAIALLELATKKLEATGGPDEADTILSMFNLAEVYESAGRLDEADRQLREIIARTLKNNVPIAENATHRRLALSQKVLSRQRPAEAEFVLGECVAFYQKVSPNSRERFLGLSLLGEALLDQKKYADAEPFLLKGFEGLKQREAGFGPDWKTRVPEAIERNIRFYEATNQPEKSEFVAREIEPEGTIESEE